MNLLESAPLWLAIILGALMLAAAAEDAARLRISNWTVLGVLAGALLAMVLEGFGLALWQNAVIFVGLLAAGTVLFGWGKVGGGDVKLIAAVGLWSDFAAAPSLLAAIFIAGGALALLILGARQYGTPAISARAAVLKPQNIPYGVAIATGTILMLVLLRT